MCANRDSQAFQNPKPRSKAARRRQRGRDRHLRAVFDENPDAFENAWLARLDSLVARFNPKKRAGALIVKDERREGSVFRILDHALNDLARLGDDVYAEYEAITRRYVEERCCRAMADAVYPPLYPSGRDPQATRTKRYHRR